MLLLAIIVIAALPLGGCSCSTKQVVKITSNDVSLKLTTDKRDYEPGEKVIVSAQVHNSSSGPISYEYGSNSRIDIVVTRMHDGSLWSGAWLLEDGETTMVRPEWVSDDVLEADEKIIHVTWWDQKIYVSLHDEHNEHIQAPAGEYRIMASFSMSGHNYDPLNPFTPLKATLTLYIG